MLTKNFLCKTLDQSLPVEFSKVKRTNKYGLQWSRRSQKPYSLPKLSVLLWALERRWLTMYSIYLPLFFLVLCRLSALEELSGIEILASDKTGTLTLNRWLCVLDQLFESKTSSLQISCWKRVLILACIYWSCARLHDQSFLIDADWHLTKQIWSVAKDSQPSKFWN